MSIIQSQGNVFIVPRAIPTRPVVQADSQPHVPLNDIFKELQEVVKLGDNIGSGHGEGTDVDRRALIIAPGYYDYTINRITTLGLATASDARLMYNMLIDSGYEPQNIRILCDILPDNKNTHPTVENILNSLTWLTSNVPPGGHRFMHFSGHGINELVGPNEKGGKLIRIVPKGMILMDDKERSPYFIRGERVSTLSVDESKLGYYYEAIVARNINGDPDLYKALIRDVTLNEYLSKLPENCTITVTLDCCASGRMLNLPTKVAGAGFRGVSEEKPEDQDGTSRGRKNKPVATTSFENSPELEVDPSLGGLMCYIMDDSPVAVQPLLETIPDNEKAMNHIKARIVFTRTYQAFRKLPPNLFTYRQLFGDVSRAVDDKRQQVLETNRANKVIQKGAYPQFVQ
ncbi:ICE-like protease (caspase) p20 domain protein, partial [Rhizoctonia solani 123E]